MYLALLIVLIDNVVSVPSSRWKAIEIKVQEAGTVIECSVAVQGSPSKINAILVTRMDADRFHAGRSYHPLYETGLQDSSHFRYEADQPGSYVLLLDNRLEARHATDVLVKVDLWNYATVHPVTLPKGRRQVVVLLSVLFFLSVVAYSARKLMA